MERGDRGLSAERTEQESSAGNKETEICYEEA